MSSILKRTLSLILAITIVFSSAYVGVEIIDFGKTFTIKANAASVDDLTFELSDDETYYIVASCDTSAEGELVIPSTYNGKPVTSIGRSAFQYCSSLTSVTIPDGVIYIGEDGFADCENLTTVHIPNSLTGIGMSCFDGCTNLISITLPDGIKRIDWYAFYDCKNLASITIPDSVTDIGSYAFSGCSSLTEITLPCGVGWYAFSGCTSLTAVTISGSATTIGGFTFADCENLVEIKVNEENTEYISVDGILFDKNKTMLIKYPQGKADTHYTIPDSVNCIGSYAFAGCDALTSLSIPASVKSISNNAFEYCSSLSSVIIPDSVTSISDRAFSNFSGLETIVIPDNVTSIGEEAFYACEGLKSIRIGEGVESIGSEAFTYCSGLETITIPDSVTSIGEEAFYECRGLKSIRIGEGVESIGSMAFGYCSALTEVYITDIVKWCNIDFGSTSSNPQYFADKLYLNNELLTDVVIPYGVTTVPVYAFSCENISSVIIPDSVTVIGDGAFYKCTNLKSITIPDSVESIGSYAFQWDNLESVFYSGTESDWQNITVNEGNQPLLDATIYYNSPIHQYGDWVVDTAATCTQNGSVHKNCLLCGKIVLETVYPLGHNYSAEWTVDEAATCTGEGSKSHHCTRCDSKNDVTVIDATGHHYGSWYITKAATCTQDGEQSENCVDCNHAVTQTLPATGHSYSDQWTVDIQATCARQGSKSHHCLNCDSKNDVTVTPVDSTNHIYSDWQIEEQGTCENTGKRVRMCADCGETEYGIVPATGHSYGDWQIIKAATCTEDGSKHRECTDCGKGEDLVVAATGHKFSDYVCTLCNSSMFTFEEGYDYSADTPCWTLTSCDPSASGKITIPSKYQGFPVRELACYAFKECGNITSVIIPKGVTDIQNATFIDCPKLKSVTIPVSVRSIYLNAFYRCDSLSEVHYKGTYSQWKNDIYFGEGTENVQNAKLYCYPDKPELKTSTNVQDGVKLTWNKAGAAESYEIYRKVKGGSYSKIGTSSKTYFTDKNTKSNTTYYYVVKSVNETGKSGSSNAKSIKRFVLMSVKNTKNGVQLTWTKISGVKAYSIWRKVKGGSYEIIGATLSASQTTFTDTSAKSGKKYYYFVMPLYKDDSISADSNTLSKYYLADPTLKTPTSTKSGISLKWSKVNGAQGYIIYRKTGSGSYKKLKTEKGVTNLSYVDKSAKKGKKYTYKVKAYYSKTYSAYSNTKTIKDKY